MDKLYSISKTAEILDVTPKTLRVWDKENKLKPILTSGGHRRYRESDINKLLKMNTSIIEQTNISKDTILWGDIRIGDVVIEGDKNEQYRVLTGVDGKHWEYFDVNTGNYRSTSPEYCHYLVKGQLGCDRELIKIEYNNA